MEDSNMPPRKMSRAGESLYMVLGLKKGASPDEIKRAYRSVCYSGVVNINNLPINEVVGRMFVNPTDARFNMQLTNRSLQVRSTGIAVMTTQSENKNRLISILLVEKSFLGFLFFFFLSS
ncbi:hypothetical protein XENOCAPTIV_000813 [Xenoophorus captivus]|uniref:J domain-containing protein n=1 Tax=Xenoophorus captivus TaxID=1517983 RepID=A0ABV0R613_9TELE